MKNTKANFNALLQENEKLKEDLNHFKNEFYKTVDEIHEIDKLFDELKEINENNYRINMDIKVLSQAIHYELSKQIFPSKKIKELNKQIESLTLGFVDVNI